MLKRSICLAQGNRKPPLNGGRDTCWGSTSDWRFTRTFYWVSIGPLHKAPEAVAMVWAARKIEVTELVFLLGECLLLTFTSGGGDDGARSKEETVTTRAKAFPSHVGSRMGLPDIGVSMKCRRPDALEFTRAVSMLIFLGMVPNLWHKRVDTRGQTGRALLSRQS